ncbi:hypothetical protein DSO57_1030939 [Entomophthora muscae]|uniref:Uncharacterized protein n=1 Tax=Entomophthora muscae TaxID=34485 RepID=A0ACC2TZJ3_9FUNG|nr:hypothetical protein DSO57_1030939 [Entomophthora muscae]
MFNKLKSSLARRGSSEKREPLAKKESLSDSIKSTSSQASLPPTSRNSSASIPSQNYSVSSSPKDTKNKNPSLKHENSTSKIREKFLNKAQRLTHKLTDTQIDFDLSDVSPDVRWDIQLAVLYLNLPATQQVSLEENLMIGDLTEATPNSNIDFSNLSLGHRQLHDPSDSRKNIQLLIANAQKYRFRMTELLGEGTKKETSIDYLSVFEAITEYLHFLNPLLELLSHGSVILRPDFEVVWSCSLSSKTRQGPSSTTVTQSSVVFAGLTADWYFAKLALAGLSMNWGNVALSACTFSSKDTMPRVIISRYLRAAGTYVYLSEHSWPADSPKPFDCTPSACLALAHIAQHQAELVGFKSMDKNIQTDNIGSSLSCLAEQLNQAHYNILSSRMSTVARSILTFVIDGAQLYKGLGLVWRALALDAVNDRRAMHAASSAKAAFKKFTNSQSTNNVHSTLRLKYLAGASLLKARYIKIYQQISEVTNFPSVH